MARAVAGKTVPQETLEERNWEAIETFVLRCSLSGASTEFWPSLLDALRDQQFKAFGVIQEIQFGARLSNKGLVSGEMLPAQFMELDRGWWIDSQGLLIPPTVRVAWLHQCPYSAEQALLALPSELHGVRSPLLYDPEDAKRVSDFFAPNQNAVAAPASFIGDNVIALDRPSRTMPTIQLLRAKGSAFAGTPISRVAAYDLQIDRTQAEEWAVRWGLKIEGRCDTARPVRSTPVIDAALIALKALHKTPPSSITQGVCSDVDTYLRTNRPSGIRSASKNTVTKARDRWAAEKAQVNLGQ